MESSTAHGLFQQVTVSFDDQLAARFLNALKEIKNNSNQGFSSNFNIQQNKDALVFTAHFHDAKNDYQLTLEANSRK